MNTSNGVRTDAQLFDQALEIPLNNSDSDNNNYNYNVEGVHLINQGGCSGTSGTIGQLYSRSGGGVKFGEQMYTNANEDVYDGTIGRSAILQQSIMRRQPLGGSGGASVSCVGLCSLLVCDTCGVIFTLVIVSFVMLLLG